MVQCPQKKDKCLRAKSAETGLYYLQSRYYDPAIGRFINADSLVSTGQGVLGNNMFAYCGNNPANRADPSGSAFVHVAYNFDGVSNSMFLILGGGGGGCAYALSAASSGTKVIRNSLTCLCRIDKFQKIPLRILV